MEVGMRIVICRRRADENPSDGSDETIQKTAKLQNLRNRSRRPITLQTRI